MDKTALIILCLLMLLLLGGCKTKEQNDPLAVPDKTVTVQNEVKDANVWILPETEENKKTTVWGAATAANVQTGEGREVPLCEPGDGGLYLLRMIDTDSFYYAASGLKLDAGFTITLKEDENRAVTAEVTNETGALQGTYEVFSAKL